jgi:hypothetical protein
LEAKLIINGIETQVGVNLLKDISSDIPDNENYQAIFHELAQSKVAEIRANISYKDKLSKDTVQLLLRDKDSEVLSNIIRNEVAQIIANDDDIDYLISTLNEDNLVRLISYLDDYRNIDLEKHVEKLLSLENPVIDLAIAENHSMPKKFLNQLLKSNDLDVANSAKSTLEY